MVPHLVTTLTGPINELEQRILESMPAIERWFRLEWMEHTPPFYSDVTVRNAAYKLAPVSTGLYPDGFNHLIPTMLPLAVQAAMAAIEKICPEAKNLLLLAGPNTQDSGYLTNLQRLVLIFSQAGLNVRLGSLDPTLLQPTEVTLPDGSQLTLEPLLRTPRRLGLKDFDPCTILVNHPLSEGTPSVLENLHEQYLLPPLHAGQSRRRLSQHWQNYEEVAKKFAKLLGMDPWLINPMHALCADVDWQPGAGREGLHTQVDALLGKIRRKHKEYGINDKPFVVLKADLGSDDFGVLTVRDVKDLEAALAPLVAATAPGAAPIDVIIQEGIPTCEQLHRAPAEPVVTMIDRYVVGGVYRTHAQRAMDESLTVAGAEHVPLGFDESHQLPKPGARPGASAPNRFYMVGVIARLAMLAAAYELEATDPDAEVYD
jgi:glutamate--cysteine ligase